MKTSGYIFALFLISIAGFAQKPKAKVSGEIVASVDSVKKPRLGSDRFSVGVDACGALMAAATSWGQYEAFLRVGMLSPFYPVVEVGIGSSNTRSEETEIKYKTNSPYFRVGCDYNFSRKSSYPGKILAGVRYGFSRFSFDVSSPDIADPVYGASMPFSYSGIKSSVHWFEVVAGLEAKIVGSLSLGWTFRYKFRIAEKVPEVGHAWYVPGYGRNDSHALGGTFNIILNL